MLWRCEGLSIFLWWDPFCVYLPHPHLYPHLSNLTGKTAIGVILILFSLVGIYLMQRTVTRQRLRLWAVAALPGPFAGFVCLTRDPARALCSSLALSKGICLEPDQEAEFSNAASRGCPCQIRTAFSVPEQLTSRFLPICPFVSQCGWRFDPRSISFLPSQVPAHTCRTVLSTSLLSVSFCC